MTSRQSGNNGSTTNLQNFAYDWDHNGNLNYRQSVNQGLTETFQHDALNRMWSSQVTGQAAVTQTFDPVGNIQSKSDVGSYGYDTNKKHAVTSAGANTYAYNDANGNMTSRNGSSINWTTYNYPSQINSGGNYSQFFYGANRNRYKQVANYNGTTETTIYAGGLFEKVSVPTGTGYRHYITAGGNTVLYTRWDNGAEQTAYITSDHLGGTSSITDQNANVIANESFEAFGKRRNPSTWSGSPTSGDLAAIGNTTRHGFTGHEHLDNLGLIHMNGRVYDPTIGRFISADPNIDGGLGTQGLNRFGYVGNGPLSRTDPSGFRQCWRLQIPSTIPPSAGTVRNNEIYATLATIYTTAEREYNYVCDDELPSVIVTASPGGEVSEIPTVSTNANAGKPKSQGCSAAMSSVKAYANALPSRLFGPVSFNSPSEMALLKQYFQGDTKAYVLSGAEMAQAKSYVGKYSTNVLGSVVTPRADGLSERNVFFGRFASDAPLLDGLLGTATGIFSGKDLVGVRDTFNFDFKDRGGYPYGTMANIGVGLVRLDAASCAGDVRIPITGGTQ